MSGLVLVSVLDRAPSPSEEAAIERELQRIDRFTEEVHAVLSALSPEELKRRMDRLSHFRVLPSTTLFRALQPTATPDQKGAYLAWYAANQKLLAWVSQSEPIRWERILELASVLGIELRTTPTGGGNCDYPEVADLPALRDSFIRRVLDQLGSDHPVREAARLYQWLISAHFFADANGRLSRFVAEWRLLQAQYPPLAFASDVEAFVSATDRDGRYGPVEAVGCIGLGIERAVSLLKKD